jgi:hypothetical protein
VPSASLKTSKEGKFHTENFKRRKVEKKRKFSSNLLGKSLKKRNLKHQIDMAMPQDKKQLTFNCFYFVTVCSDDFFDAR